MGTGRYAILAVACLALTVTWGCAVQSSKAPQISKQTATELNIAVVIDQANKDYTTFFQDVGQRRAAGQLTDDQVNILNAGGTKVQTSLQEANKLLKQYQATSDEGLVAQITNLGITASQDIANLIVQRAQMLAAPGGKK